jgi:hypothetical protein
MCARDRVCLSIADFDSALRTADPIEFLFKNVAELV